MSKILTSLVAVAAIGAAAVGTSSGAEAQGWGPGWGPGPFIAGALIGGAIVAATAPQYYGGYGPYTYYANPYGPYYGPGCQRVWNGYYWVRACY